MASASYFPSQFPRFRSVPEYAKSVSVTTYAGTHPHLSIKISLLFKLGHHIAKSFLRILENCAGENRALQEVQMKSACQQLPISRTMFRTEKNHVFSHMFTKQHKVG